MANPVTGESADIGSNDRRPRILVLRFPAETLLEDDILGRGQSPIALPGIPPVSETNTQAETIACESSAANGFARYGRCGLSHQLSGNVTAAI